MTKCKCKCLTALVVSMPSESTRMKDRELPGGNTESVIEVGEAQRSERLAEQGRPSPERRPPTRTRVCPATLRTLLNLEYLGSEKYLVIFLVCYNKYLWL